MLSLSVIRLLGLPRVRSEQVTIEGKVRPRIGSSVMSSVGRVDAAPARTDEIENLHLLEVIAHPVKVISLEITIGARRVTAFVADER